MCVHTMDWLEKRYLAELYIGALRAQRMHGNECCLHAYLGIARHKTGQIDGLQERMLPRTYTAGQVCH